MNLTAPAIDVVIPAYNAEAYLAAALASVHAQTLAPRSIIVVDDGSRDRTADVAEAGGATVLRQANGGPGAARNTGVRHATAEWIAFLDADDWWEPRFLERATLAARTCPDVRVIFTDYSLDDPPWFTRSWFASDPRWRHIQLKPVSDGIFRCDRTELVDALIRSMSFISTSALLVRRDAFVACGGFDEELRSAEDLDLTLRLFVVSTAAVVNEPLSVYRKHAANVTADPVRSAAWERRLWQRIIAAPQRYPSGLGPRLAVAYPAKVRSHAVAALRFGDFAQARELFGEARAQGAAFASAGIALAQAADSTLGRGLHGALRAMWRRLPRRA